MKKIALILLLSILTIPIMTGCGNEYNTSGVESTNKQLVENSDIPQETSFEYNGTFNEIVFEQMCQNIKIEDVIISFPCTRNEFVSELSIDGIPLVLENIVNYELLYNKELIGSCSFKYTEEDNLDNSIMTGLSLDKNENSATLISVGEITFQYSKQQIIELLGEPTNTEEYLSGSEKIDYFADNYRYMCFMFDVDDILTSIEFYDENI